MLDRQAIADRLAGVGYVAESAAAAPAGLC